MESDRTWMYGDRDTLEFVKGVDEFCNSAVTYRDSLGMGEFYCHCVECGNLKKVSCTRLLRDHIFRRGFRPQYHVWAWHGKEGKYRGNSSENGMREQEDEIYFSEEDHSMECEDDDEEVDIDDDIDNVDEMMQGVKGERPNIFKFLSEAAEQPLYPGCTKYTKLTGTSKLYSIKTEGNWTDSSFTKLLAKLTDMFSDDNTVPKSNYYAKKLMCPFGLEYEKIHACPNDCVLYRKQYANFNPCPTCGKSRYKRKGVGDKKGPPAKVLWYLPIIPRFKRLFSIKKDAKNLRWHADGRKKDGLLKHPADSPEWKNINRLHESFGLENRNLRLGLCTDGMNPFGTLSSQHSTWPVLLVIYNLPPWLCMKRKYMMLSLLISGPKQLGNDIDVYLEPLIEDLRKMWDEEVSVYDAHANEMFTLRAMLFCTINDFPAYGNLSGLLRRDHPYRKKKAAFNREVEEGIARRLLTGYEVYEQVKGIETIFGKSMKGSGSEVGGLWKKESVFWKLAYWKDLHVRHCLDVMHIEKNVCEAILGTLMNIPKVTKDSKGVRLYLESKGLRPELWLQVKDTKERKEMEKGNSSKKGKGKGKCKTKVKEKKDESVEKNYLPPACYTMSKAEKRAFCECFYGIKVPSGYSSNMKRFVTLNGELKLSSMKSHDCHVMMQVFLPIAIRGILPKHMRDTITELCEFFNIICSKVLHPSILDTLQANVVQTLCKFEMYFPPSLFDIMVHLVIHLVREIKWCGPVFLRWSYPFERRMGTLSHYVRNPAHPEGSMIQGTVGAEVGNFVAEYVASAEPTGLPKSRHEGRLQGKGTIGSKLILPPHDKLLQAHFYVLHHIADVNPYMTEHLSELKSENPSKGARELMQLHNKTFVPWFRSRILDLPTAELASVPNMIQWLAYGPRDSVNSYEGYDINGYTFWTERQDEKSLSTQNSGVSLAASSTQYASSKDKSPVDSKLLFYGRVQEIWELNYPTFTVGLFKCKWVDNNRRCVNRNPPFTLVDMARLRESLEPFVFASQPKQVFYVTDPADKNWSIVLPGKRSILGIGDVGDEQEYDAFEDTPPFTCPGTVVIEDVDTTNYMRVDHTEGILDDS
ncbi:uncharacterized protein [Spinacia oleracea]|uniref:Uncharacterized protein n=1 Tax=Spinacia oleracea TaxID=3562 RepID=A0ABM3RQZ7_SPIOL|nr:uncharacterized protein LOC130471765 [Spinacia oleracea]